MERRRPLIGITTYTEISGDGEVQLVLRKAYADRVREAGGIPVLLPLGDAAEAAATLQRLDGLMLPGGDDVDPRLFGEPPHPKLGDVDRALDDFELSLLRQAAQDDLPILAICRGAQVLNVSRGGTLIQDIPTQFDTDIVHTGPGRMEPKHEIEVPAATLLARIVGAGQHGVNSRHHQAVKDIGHGLIVAATSDDGIIEALEDPDSRFCVGVQFHPEDMGERYAPLFEAFVQAAANDVSD